MITETLSIADNLARIVYRDYAAKGNATHFTSADTLRIELEEFEPTTIVLHHDTEKMKRYMAEVSMNKISPPTKPPSSYIIEGKTYGTNINYTLKTWTEDVDAEGNTVTKGNVFQPASPQFTIPNLVNFYSGENGQLELDNPGGYFIIQGKRKFLINKRELISTHPKPRGGQKNMSMYHLTFYSFPPSFLQIETITSPQYIICKMMVNPDTNKFDITISSGKNLTSVYLTEILSYISMFDKDNLINFISAGFDSTVKLFIDKIFSDYAPQNKPEEFDDRFFPHLKIAGDHIDNWFNSRLSYTMMIIELIRMSLLHAFFPQEYPDRAAANMRKTLTAGSLISGKIFETITKDLVELANSYKDGGNDGSTKPTSLQTVISNMFNNRETQLGLVRQSTSLSNYQSIIMPLQISNNQKKKLTNNYPIRGINETMIAFEDVCDTSNSSNTIGLIKRMTAGTKVVDATRKSLHKTFVTIWKSINQYVKDKYGTDTTDMIDPVGIFIGEESLYPVTYIGMQDVKDFITHMKIKKRRGQLESLYVGIEVQPCYTTESPIHITTTNGISGVYFMMGNKRLVRPYFVVNEGKLNIVPTMKDVRDIDYIIRSYPDVLEFLDGGQLLYSNICTSVDDFFALSDEEKRNIDYVEMSEDLCLSINSSLLPDINKNAVIRGIFGNLLMKQLIFPPFNYARASMESGPVYSGMIMRSCHTNMVYQESGAQDIGKGANIMIMFGDINDNFNDAVVVAKEAIDSGMLLMTNYQPSVIDTTDDISSNDPDRWITDQSKINPNTGYPDNNTIVTMNEAYAKKTSMRTDTYGTTAKDTSVLWKFYEPGRIEWVRKTETAKSSSLDIMTTICNTIKEGDKFVTENVQKGTCGKIVTQAELPYTKDGSRPVVIINSTSLISRSTFSGFIQAFLINMFGYCPYDEEGMVRFRQAKSINTISIEDLYNMFVEELTKRYPEISTEKARDMVGGLHTIYHPVTGEPYKKKVLLCPMMYCKLSQTASSKINIRGRGKANKYGQPPSGKKNSGGSRQGEMEIENFISYGVSNTLQSIIEDSIQTHGSTYTCTECGMFLSMVYGIRSGEVTWQCEVCEARSLNYKPYISYHPKALNFILPQTHSRGLNIIFDN